MSLDLKMEKLVNGQDKKDLSVILERMEQHETRQQEMRDDIKFIKENLFDPHQGLWAETKQNTQFRTDTKKWRGVIGAGFVGLFFKQVYDLFV